MRRILSKNLPKMKIEKIINLEILEKMEIFEISENFKNSIEKIFPEKIKNLIFDFIFLKKEEKEFVIILKKMILKENIIKENIIFLFLKIIFEILKNLKKNKKIEIFCLKILFIFSKNLITSKNETIFLIKEEFEILLKIFFF